MRTCCRCLVGAAVTLIPVACGGGDPSTLETTVDAASVLTAVEFGMVEMGSTSILDSQEPVNCDSGTMTLLEGGIGESITSGTFKRQVLFDGCLIDGVVLDGTLTIKNAVSLPSDFTSHLKGKLTVTGAIDGLCKLSITSRQSADADTGGTKTTGTVCGFDLQEVAPEYAPGF